MPAMQAAAARRSISGGALLALSLWFAFYQVSSLVLGPSSERVLHVSLHVPPVDLPEISQPVISEVNLALRATFTPSLPSVLSPVVSHRRLPQGPKVLAHPSPQAPSPSGTIRPSPAPSSTASVGDARNTHYHDADEGSLRLARRR